MRPQSAMRARPVKGGAVRKVIGLHFSTRFRSTLRTSRCNMRAAFSSLSRSFSTRSRRSCLMCSAASLAGPRPFSNASCDSSRLETFPMRESEAPLATHALIHASISSAVLPASPTHPPRSRRERFARCGVLTIVPLTRKACFLQAKRIGLTAADDRSICASGGWFCSPSSSSIAAA